MEEKETKNIEKKNNHKHHNKNDKKLLEKINVLEEDNKALNDKILRLSAEMQNMRKRHEDEISKIYKYEGESLIKKLLSVLDNFERAVNMDDDNLEDEVSKFLEGFKLIYKTLSDDLKGIGVSEIECLNNTFDPETMEAVMTEKVDGVESGIVTSVMLKGYKYNDKVIRPAMVKVSE